MEREFNTGCEWSTHHRFCEWPCETPTSSTLRTCVDFECRVIRYTEHYTERNSIYNLTLYGAPSSEFAVNPVLLYKKLCSRMILIYCVISLFILKTSKFMCKTECHFYYSYYLSLELYP